MLGGGEENGLGKAASWIICKVRMFTNDICPLLKLHYSPAEPKIMRTGRAQIQWF
jgi:hypothetical protein